MPACLSALMVSERIVVMGASAGGIRALQVLASSLPARFPAPILLVQHIGSRPSILPELLETWGPLRAAHAADGERVEAGRIHVAPPDYHMLVDGEVIRLSHGPKEQYTRPAIDPLFRSAAVSWADRAIGVVMSGHLDDGTDGLGDIKASGGVAVVQDPSDAEVPSMPMSALRYVEVDYKVPAASMGPLLASLAAEPLGSTRTAPRKDMVIENDLLLGKGDFMENLKAIGEPSTFVCPECHGSLWEVKNARPRRFRCHTGHGFTLRALSHAQGVTADEAMWNALRALQEKQLLLEALAESRAKDGDAEEASRLREEAQRSWRSGETLRALIEKVPPSLE